jgi:urease accessory protein UreH
MLSQLGPGVLRGDAVTTHGRVRAGAHLIVTNQTATRLMGGTRPATSRSVWSVDDGAVLELIGKPLLANPNARYANSTNIELGPGAAVLSSDIACVPGDAEVRMQTSVSRFGRELFYDNVDAGATAPDAVGTFALVGIEPLRVPPLVAALDRAVDSLSDARAGVGALNAGAFVRVVAADAWTVECALVVLRAAARAYL